MNGTTMANSVAATPRTSVHRCCARNDRPAIIADSFWDYGSFWKAADAMICRLPSERFERLNPSGPSTTGHMYITRRTTISPTSPGLNCQVLLTAPELSNVKVGIAVSAVDHELATCTSIIKPLQVKNITT